MIIFDASYLVVFLNKNPEPAKDRLGQPVVKFKERVEYLASSINSSGEQIGIPTPAMAEVLVRAGKGRSQFVAILSDRMRFQIVPFDARGAIEAAELIAMIKTNSETWGTHAKVKFDIQIVATAKAEDATTIYSDDRDIESFAKRLKIPVMRICDLPLPPPPIPTEIETGPIGEQRQLFGTPPPLQQTLQPPPASSPDEVRKHEPSSEQPESVEAQRPQADAELKAAAAPPTPVRRGDEGRVEGETTRKESTKTEAKT
jgi:predicted nucleic acid-binding protein